MTIPVYLSSFLSPILLPNSIPPHSLSPALFVLLALAIYTGVTVSFLGRRFGDWRFSWSYILGWVALLMTFFAGTEAEGVGRLKPGAWQATSEDELTRYPTQL